jgi:hypothetical protein
MTEPPPNDDLPDDGLIHFSGIDALTGQPLLEPLSPEGAAALACGTQPPDEGHARRLKQLEKRKDGKFLGLPDDVLPNDLPKTGWAVVFAADTPAEVRSALRPLLDHRKAAMGSKRYHELEYSPNQTLEAWLKARKVYAGQIDPQRLPYYVLLVGGPEAIPFEFQYQLDAEYAVGRLAFESAEEYRRYAEGVVAYETAAAPPHGREAVYWAPRSGLDAATQLSERFLIGPLFEGIPESDTQSALTAPAADLGYRARRLRGPEATKAALAELLHPPAGAAGPALLVTASHGLGLPRGTPAQRQEQGALLCQDWPYGRPVEAGHRLAAADVLDEARLRNLVAFLFACYGAGTPDRDSFPQAQPAPRDYTAEKPFVAALPRRLLAHPNGPALAVIGHVERAWGFSIRPQGLDPQVGPYRNLLRRILNGERVGHATKDFGEKYALLSAQLLNLQNLPASGRRLSDTELARLWIDRNDFQNYILLGDPAVRLRSDELR